MKTILAFASLCVLATTLAGCIVAPEPYGGHGYYEHRCGWRCR